jgi:hypothetical protein
MLSDCFAPDELRRGRDLIAKKAVLLSSTSDTLVRALVKDARLVIQSEDIASSRASAACNCNQGRKGHLCKHLAAVVLTLEERGFDFVSNKQELCVVEAEARPVPKKFERPKKERPEKIRLPAFSYPSDVEDARTFFRDNGFDLAHPLAIDDLLNAKKLLMRVFHPDKGGTHEETVELNRHFAAVRAYLQS